jgi:hypothetical protein
LAPLILVGGCGCARSRKDSIRNENAENTEFDNSTDKTTTRLIAGLAGTWIWRSWRHPMAAPASPVIRSLAVLPLENLTGDPSQDYFADGMTDALITDLAQIGSLRVISRTSMMRYKGTRKPLADIAQELGVEGIVEGTVFRSGNRVRK